MPGGRPAASLPMYDWPEVRWATDALWAAIRDRLKADGIEAPDALDRARSSEEVWTDPGLVLSQACGYPFATRLCDRVGLVGTPVYAVEGCKGEFYSSVIVARRREAGLGIAGLARRRIAFNAPDSLSGFLALRAAIRADGIDPAAGKWVETGSHRASIRAVAGGEADVAAIDAVCWALAREHEADAATRLQAVAWTPFRPGLPLITALDRGALERAAIGMALDQALDSPETEQARAALHIASHAVLNASDYAPIAAMSIEPRLS